MAVMPHSVFDVRLPNPRAQEVLTALLPAKSPRRSIALFRLFSLDRSALEKPLSADCSHQRWSLHRPEKC